MFGFLGFRLSVLYMIRWLNEMREFYSNDSLIWWIDTHSHLFSFCFCFCLPISVRLNCKGNEAGVLFDMCEMLWSGWSGVE